MTYVGISESLSNIWGDKGLYERADNREDFDCGDGYANDPDLLIVDCACFEIPHSTP